MSGRWLLCALLVACGGASKKSNTTPGPLSPAQIAERAMPSIVLIQTPNMLGTGFVVWKDGRIATNLHVLAGATEAKVILNDKREFTQVEVLGVDPEHDLAVLRVQANDLVPLTLGDSATVKAGERVVAIGHPLGLGNTISDGIVSAIREMAPQVTMLQVTAPIAQGSSGGPIMNDRAEVIAVATLFASEGQNLNFGVPVAYLKPLLLGERPVSLKAFHDQVQQHTRQQAGITLLAGCTVDEVKLTILSISDAIKVGVPLYNKGDEQACFDEYQKTALKVVGSLKGCPGVRESLLGGLAEANRVDGAGKKAWALRHAFDKITDAFSAAVEMQKQEEQQQQRK